MSTGSVPKCGVHICGVPFARICRAIRVGTSIVSRPVSMSHDVFHVQVDIGVGGDGRSRFVPRDVREGGTHTLEGRGE